MCIYATVTLRLDYSIVVIGLALNTTQKHQLDISA